MSSSSPRVFNKHHHNAPVRAVYIGRGSPWGNPFVVGKDGKRDEVCEQYEAWVLRSPDMGARWIRDNISHLIDKDLLCFCAPQRCHGDFLLELAQEKQREQLSFISSTTGGWVRVALPADPEAEPGTAFADGARFALQVDDYGNAGQVISASPRARWLIGHRCRDVADWVRRRKGSITRMDKVRELVMERQTAIALHPSNPNNQDLSKVVAS